MKSEQYHMHRCRAAMVWNKRAFRSLVFGIVMLILGGGTPALMSAQQSATASLVFDRVAVVDVEHGELIPDQRVVIVGNRITTVGSADTLKMPTGARIIDAWGKYLIPGLWDLHVHPRQSTHLFYPLLVANGVTGIRDAGSEIPIDTLMLWRQEVLDGTRPGPPRQILVASYIDNQGLNGGRSCIRKRELWICVQDSADASHVVDSLVAAGVTALKFRGVGRAMYFTLAAEARRAGIPFGGHAEQETTSEASDSGATLIDHPHNRTIDKLRACWGTSASVEECRPLSQRLKRNGTWLVPTLIRYEGAKANHAQRISRYFTERTREFWADSLISGNWLHDSMTDNLDTLGFMSVMQHVEIPIVAGTDAGEPVLNRMVPGFALHAELAMYVAEGLTPLSALQSATLNPAKMLHGTDSLGTVAPGKLADLVLLDANPLADITNTTMIRAVVANGRYYNRTALDSLLAEVQAKGP